MAENGVVDSLSIEIGASSTLASNEVKKLANSLKSLKESVNNFKIGNFKKELGKLGGTEVNKITKLADALKGLKGLNISAKLGDNFANLAAGLDLLEQSHIDRLEQFTQAVQGLKDARNLSIGDKLPNQLTNLAEAVSKVSADTVKRLDEMTAAIERLKGIDLRGFASAVKEAQKASGKATSLVSGQSNSALATVQNATDKDIFDMVARDFGASSTEASRLHSIIKSIPKECEKLSPLMKSFGNALRSAAGHAANLAKNLLKFAGKTFKNIWDKSAFKGLEKSLSRLDKIVSSFGRIAFYRAIRSAIKYVTDALKEGTENAYHFAQEFGDATHYIAEAYDEMASANFKMSNQLGAAWSTLIAAIEPIILRIINLVTRAADAVTQLFALLSGKGTYMKAVDYNKQWADSANKASNSAKEWKNQLLGFDEINRLEAPSDTGRGSGGSDYTDYENMFEEMPVSDFFQQVKDAFENGQWAELGQLLGNKFNEIIDSIKWGEYGAKLGRGLQGIISTAYNFLKTANFVDLGAGIAEFINNAIDKINFEEAGRLSMRLHTALWDIIYGAVLELNWVDIAVGLSNFILGALTELAEWLEGLDPKAIAKSLKDFFGNIKYEEIADAFKRVVKDAFELALAVTEELFPNGLLPTLAKGVGNFIKKIFESLNDEDFQEAHNILSYKLDRAFFGETWANFWWSRGEYAGKELIMGMIHGEDYNAKDFQDSTNTFLGNPVSEILGGINTEATETSQVLSDVRDTVVDATTGASESVSSLASNGSTALTELEAAATTAGEGIQNSLYGIRDAATEAIGSLTGSVGITETGETLTGMTNTTGMTSTSGETGESGFGGVDAVIAKLQELADQAALTQTAYADMATSIGESMTAINDSFTGVDTTWTTMVENMTTTTETLNKTFSEFGDFVSDVSTSNKAQFKSMKTTFNEMKVSIANDMNELNIAMSTLRENWQTSTYAMSWYMIELADYTLSCAIYIIEAFNLIRQAAIRTSMALLFLVILMGALGMGGGVNLNSVSVPTFATGGFPEDGLFFANHGEMVGQFSNGKTAVANNEQITQGIAEATYGAFMQAFSDSGGMGRGRGDIVLNINGREFAREVWDDQKAVANEHGTSLINNA